MRESCPAMAVALAGFLDDLELEGRASTAKTYRALLKPLRDAQQPVTALGAPLCRELVRERLHASSVASTRTFWGALAAFARWCVDQGWIAESPMAHVPCPRRKERPHRYLSRDQARALWQAATECPPRYRTENLLLLRLLGSGLRRGEVVALRWSDVDGDALRVPAIKRGRPRVVPLAPVDVALIEALRTQRGAFSGDGARASRIFPYRGETLAYRLRKLGERARVPHVHPHLLRHTFASWAMLEGVSASLLMQLGGWRSEDMIRRVYARSAIEQAALRAAREADIPGKLFGG